MQTFLTIRHFPDRKKPCLVLEQGNEGLVIGTIRNADCEKLLKEFFGYGSVCGKMDYIFSSEEE